MVRKFRPFRGTVVGSAAGSGVLPEGGRGGVSAVKNRAGQGRFRRAFSDDGRMRNGGGTFTPPPYLSEYVAACGSFDRERAGRGLLLALGRYERYLHLIGTGRRSTDERIVEDRIRHRKIGRCQVL